jgi:glycosyltransferase involved in cell wall biosynthesis
VKLLIASYVFPPQAGIGGRRWAKFFKALHEQGIETWIITAKPKVDEQSQWWPDVKSLDQYVRPLDIPYPSVINLKEYGLIDKIRYRFALRSVKSKYPGNFYDKSCLFQLSAFPEIEQLIEKEGITHLFVSGGPFAWMAELVRLRQVFPNLKLVADFRDPWVNNRDFFGYSVLDPERFAFEQKLEEEVLKNFDLIVAVNQQMLDYFKEVLPAVSRKSLMLTNGWDRDELPDDYAQREVGNEVIFSGTLYDTTEDVFVEFVEFISEPSLQESLQQRGVRFSFFGTVPNWFHRHSAQNTLIQYHGSIPIEDLNERLSRARAAMLFLTDDLNFSLSTKYYEYLKFGLPILVTSSPGETIDFIEREGLGMGLRKGSMVADSERFIELLKSSSKKVPEWLDNYEIRSLTKVLLDSLEKIR